jgi:hypothetical protein
MHTCNQICLQYLVWLSRLLAESDDKLFKLHYYRSVHYNFSIQVTFCKKRLFYVRARLKMAIMMNVNGVMTNGRSSLRSEESEKNSNIDFPKPAVFVIALCQT